MPNTTSSSNKFLIIIAGPTAVGKTDLALLVAEKYGAEIYSADSRQMYKEMSIGTAKPNRAILKRVKHHFIDHLSIHQKYSVGHYYEEVTSALEQYFLHNNIAVVTGGTGLYLKALMDGIDDFPDIPTKVVDHYNLTYNSGGIMSLQQELHTSDPDYFTKVDINNPRRLMRALSVIRATGQTYTSYLQQNNNHRPNFNQIPVLLDLPREILYERINRRVDNMIAEGLIAEAENLFGFKGVQALETVGYQELFEYFSGNIRLEEAIDLIKRNTRRYAKRQMTWFRKYGKWNTFLPSEDDIILQFINEKLNSEPFK